MRLRTRLTERFDIEHPIISAPMGMVAGGRLAAAVSNAGGLGLIGGGYGDGGWLEREFSAGPAERIGAKARCKVRRQEAASRKKSRARKGD